MIAYPFVQYQGEAEIPVIGLAHVAVAPDHRRQGVGKFMIQEALKEYEEQGIAASILYPFQHRFYRRLGWGIATEIRQYHLRLGQLREYDEAFDDPDLGVEMLREDEIEQLMSFYQVMIKMQNGQLQRPERYWRERILGPGRYAALARLSGDIIGYLIYSLYPLEPSNLLAQEMEVHEFFASTLDARDALLGFIARQNEQVETVKILLFPDEPLHLWLEDPRHVSNRHVRTTYTESAILALGQMFRLVNLQKAFEGGRRFNNVQGELNIDIVDGLLGDRLAKVVFNGKGATLQEADKKPRRLVQGTMDAFSQLYCGYVNAVTAYEQGLLEFEGHDTVEFCQNTFWLPPPRCFDLF